MSYGDYLFIYIPVWEYIQILEKPLYFNPFGQTGLLTLAIK